MTIHLAGCGLCVVDCLTCVPILFIRRQHALTVILNKHFKQYKPEQSWSSGTIRAFVALAFCVCSFYTVFLPSYQLAAQTPVSGLNSPLYVDTERGLCCYPPSLPSSSFYPSPSFFFFFTLWQLYVPWQRPWRHMWPNEPPCSASFSRITFGIERNQWEVAQGIRCADSEKEEKQPEWMRSMASRCDKWRVGQ